MVRIVLDVAAPPYEIPAVKEALAMYVERFGDTRVVSVTDTAERMEQCRIGYDPYREIRRNL